MGSDTTRGSRSGAIRVAIDHNVSLRRTTTVDGGDRWGADDAIALDWASQSAPASAIPTARTATAQPRRVSRIGLASPRGATATRSGGAAETAARGGDRTEKTGRLRRSPRTSTVGDADAGGTLGRCRHRDSSIDSTWRAGIGIRSCRTCFRSNVRTRFTTGVRQKQPGAACRSNKCLRLVADRASVKTAERAGGCRAQEGRPTSAARRRLPAARP
jgi:hypothetical protein